MITIGVDSEARHEEKRRARSLLLNEASHDRYMQRLLQGEDIPGMCLFEEGQPVGPEELGLKRDELVGNA